MNTTTSTKLLAFLGAAMYFGAGPGLADKGECRHVGGGVLTTFSSPPIRLVLRRFIIFAPVGPRPVI